MECSSIASILFFVLFSCFTCAIIRLGFYLAGLCVNGQLLVGGELGLMGRITFLSLRDFVN